MKKRKQLVGISCLCAVALFGGALNMAASTKESNTQVVNNAPKTKVDAYIYPKPVHANENVVTTSEKVTTIVTTMITTTPEVTTLIVTPEFYEKDENIDVVDAPPVEAVVNEPPPEVHYEEPPASPSGSATIDSMPDIPYSLELSGYTSEDMLFLARVIQAEAGSWPRDSRRRVGIVVLNRIASWQFPDDIKKVLYQRGQYSTTGIFPYQPTNENFRIAKELWDAFKSDVWNLYCRHFRLTEKTVFQSNFAQGFVQLVERNPGYSRPLYFGESQNDRSPDAKSWDNFTWSNDLKAQRDREDDERWAMEDAAVTTTVTTEVTTTENTTEVTTTGTTEILSSVTTTTVTEKATEGSTSESTQRIVSESETEIPVDTLTSEESSYSETEIITAESETESCEIISLS